MASISGSLKKRVQRHLPGPVGVLGFGVEGRSTTSFLKKCGVHVDFIYDQNPPKDCPSDAIYGGTGEDALSFSGIKTLFRSAGIRWDQPAIQAFVKNGGNLTSQIELFFDIIPSQQIIGITGTLGKGTCCSILYEVLAQSGMDARLGGNIGTAALDLISDFTSDTYFILELSSFQLSTSRRSPHRCAVLRTTCEHLDWHRDQAEYWRCKSNLVKSASAQDFLMYCKGEAGSEWISRRANCRKIGYGKDGDFQINGPTLKFISNGKQYAIRASELRMSGVFNLENIAAAAGLALDMGIPAKTVIKVASQFPGLPHRVEYVGSGYGIKYYNDSYATRPEATIGAINSFQTLPLGVILGGSEKHADFKTLAGIVASSPNISCLAFIGHTAQRMAEEISLALGAKKISKAICDNMEEAVDYLVRTLKNGVILLSPACASFGLFNNYKHRGEVFKSIVEKHIQNKETIEFNNQIS